MKKIIFLSLSCLFLLSGLFFLTAPVHAAIGITMSLNPPFNSSATADPEIEWELLCCTPQSNIDSKTGVDTPAYSCPVHCVGDSIGLGESWSITIPLSNNQTGVAVLKTEYPATIVDQTPSDYKDIYSAVALPISSQGSGDITMTGSVTFDSCGNNGYNVPVNFYMAKESPVTTANCPTGSVIQDGICIKSTKSSVIYSTANCPTGSVKQDGICIKSSVVYKCGDNVKYGPDEECDGTDSASCPGSCIPAGQPNQCKCLVSTPPAASGLQASQDYCSIGAAAGAVSLSWTYINNSGNLETGFDLQVSDSSDFSSLMIDRQITGLSNPSGTINSQQVLVVANPPSDKIGFAETHYWRVKVYSSESNSGWVNGQSFTTSIHAFPTPIFSVSPASAPLINGVDNVSFTDSSICYNGDNSSYPCNDSEHQNDYGWWFEDPNKASPDDTTVGDTAHSYTQLGTYWPKLRVCDDVGCCSVLGSVEVVSPRSVPEWREISPF